MYFQLIIYYFSSIYITIPKIVDNSINKLPHKEAIIPFMSKLSVNINCLNIEIIKAITNPAIGYNAIDHVTVTNSQSINGIVIIAHTTPDQNKSNKLSFVQFLKRLSIFSINN